jgi:hypothetical protein
MIQKASASAEAFFFGIHREHRLEGDRLWSAGVGSFIGDDQSSLLDETIPRTHCTRGI